MTTNLPALRPQQADLLFEQAATGWVGSTVLEHKASFDQTYSLDDAYDQGYFSSGSMSGAGVLVGPEAALKIATVYACRRVIMEDVAKMPIDLYRVTYVDDSSRVDGKRRRTSRETGHPVSHLIEVAPNHWMSPYEFVEYMVGTAVLYGSAYAYIARDEQGRPVELLPLLPGAVSRVQNQHWEITYYISSGQQVLATSDGSDLLKLHGPLQTGINSFQVTQVAREAIGLARAIEGAAARFHKNDLRPSGILTSKGKLSGEQLAKLRTEWQTKFGPGGVGGIAVLDSEFDFKTLTTTSVDSQTIENRKFQIEEICRFFRVVPTVIGHNSGTMSYGTVEQMMLAHITHTLQPWVTRLEQRLKLDLLTLPGDENLTVKLNMDALARGTLGERVTAYSNMVKVAWTPNEIREREGLDPLEDDSMDKVQLLANNTGLQPASSKAPSDSPSGSRPEPAVGDKPKSLLELWRS